MPALVKTTGSRGLHVYVPIVRGPEQKDVWRFAKALALGAGRAAHPALMTAEYRIAKRPNGRVLVDYNQNAWGRTLASIYSVRPRPRATVSTPITWTELERGVTIEDFRIDNVPARVARLGDLWKPLLQARGRFDLSAFVLAAAANLWRPESVSCRAGTSGPADLHVIAQRAARRRACRSSMRSHTALSTISIGTASSVPQTPHSQLQNSRPTKMATAFMLDARLVSHGVSRKPSRLVIASAIAGDEGGHRRPCRTAERQRRRCRP